MSKKTTAKKSSKKSQASYKGLQFNPARELPSVIVSGGDKDLQGHKKTLAWNSALDLQQNIALISWALNFYTAAVSDFRFQPKTGNEQADLALESWWRTRAAARNCDWQRRFALPDMIRAFNWLQVLHGDAGILKSQNGKLMLLEAMNISKGEGCPEEAGVADNGLVLDEWGAVQRYAVATGDTSGQLVHRQLVDYDDLIFRGYFNRPTQSRGHSPLLPALDTARLYGAASADIGIRLRVESLIGLIVFRDRVKNPSKDFRYGQNGEATGGGDTEVPENLEIELAPGLVLQLPTDAKVETLQANAVSGQGLQFLREMARAVLSVFNLSYSLYDSTAASFSGIRADYNKFRAATARRLEMTREVLDECTEWMLKHDLDTGALVLPGGIGWDQVEWEHIPCSVVNIDAASEVDYYLKLLAFGLMTREEIAKALNLSRNSDVIKRLGAEIRALEAAGVPVVTPAGTVVIGGDTPSDPPQELSNP
jgi:hypothetical protein